LSAAFTPGFAPDFLEAAEVLVAAEVFFEAAAVAYGCGAAEGEGTATAVALVAAAEALAVDFEAALVSLFFTEVEAGLGFEAFAEVGGFEGTSLAKAGGGTTFFSSVVFSYFEARVKLALFFWGGLATSFEGTATSALFAPDALLVNLAETAPPFFEVASLPDLLALVAAAATGFASADLASFS